VRLIASEHARIFDVVRRAGYDLGFSSSRGLAPLGPGTNPLNLQRMWMNPNLSHSYFRATLAMPRFAYRRR
jgi:hypothetical protein